VRLSDGGLLLHSPVRLDAETRQALDALGPVRCVVAPSKVHHFFVGDYASAYPQARLFAAPGLPEKRPDLHFHAVLSDEPPPEWHGVVEQHVFRGLPLANEVVFFHPASRTVVFTDLVFNMVEPPPGRARLFCWLVGASGRVGPHRMLRVAMRDRRAARESVRHILGWDFDRVVVTHGDVIEHGGKPLVAAGFAFLG
jgi:hypothetical protein